MSHLDNRKTRVSEIYTNEADKAADKGSTGITVVINIDTVLPILVFKQSLIDSKSLISTPTPVAKDSAICNTLGGTYSIGVDPITNKHIYSDRYTYISTANSIITGTKVRLYYDNKYSDIIIVPETDYINNGIDTGVTYELTGYAVGSINSSNITTNFESSMGDVMNNNVKLPLVNSNIAINSEFIKLPGMSFGANRDSANTTFYVGNAIEVAKKGNLHTTIIDLGSSSNLLIDSDDMLPLHSIYQVAVSKFNTKYLGYKKVPLNYRIGISLNF